MMKGMMNRKIPKEILDVFEKYIDNKVRHLNREDAVNMLVKEFRLTPDQAENMFETFDKDKNGLMSIWEFQQFFVCMGNQAHEVISKFQEMDTDGSGKIDAEEAREGLKKMQTATGRPLDDREIDFFIETTTNEEGQMDLGTFTNLLHRLKLYNAPAPPKGVKIGTHKI